MDLHGRDNILSGFFPGYFDRFVDGCFAVISAGIFVDLFNIISHFADFSEDIVICQISRFKEVIRILALAREHHQLFAPRKKIENFNLTAFFRQSFIQFHKPQIYEAIKTSLACHISDSRFLYTFFFCLLRAQLTHAFEDAFGFSQRFYSGLIFISRNIPFNILQFTF